MIKSLTMPDVPFTNAETVEMGKYNFVFGNNGTGKSSITRMIYKEYSHEDYKNVIVDSDAQILIFNKEFSQRTFKDKAHVPGVFLLGEDAGKIEDELKIKEDEIKRLENNLVGLDSSRKKLCEDISTSESTFFETCWNSAETHRKKFNLALEGRRQKSGFAKGCLDSYKGKPLDISDEKLIIEINRAYASTLETHSVHRVINQDGLHPVESNPIFQKIIIGDENIDLGKLIKLIGNSNWVHNGLTFLDLSMEICPFCQQSISKELNEKIHAVFNEEYNKDIATLKKLLLEYQQMTDEINNDIYFILQDEVVGYNYTDLVALYEKTKEIVANNIRKIEEKISAPSNIVVIESIKDLIDRINTCIDDLNILINENNNIAKNRKLEQGKVSALTIDYLANNVLGAIICDYINRLDGSNKAIEGLNTKIRNTEIEKSKQNQILSELRSSVSSIDRTLNFMQMTMSSIGFTNFKIIASDDKKGFRVVRNDGSCVENTLSEGEYGFISFLYFYYLIIGSESAIPSNNKKIVVIDDPISSLDSNGLFYITGLIDHIIRSQMMKDNNIEQIVIFTHNTYFLKQIIELTRGIKIDKPKYFIIEKSHAGSTIKEACKSQFESAYESLWRLVLLANTSDVQIVLNAMRRIIDDFLFKYLGKDKYELYNELPQESQTLYRSLLVITNAGSHDIPDDFTFCSCGTDIEGYRKVFRGIFIATGFEKHYEQMKERITGTI